MSDTYVYVDGNPPQTRDELEEVIQKMGNTIAKIEFDIYKRERKRQAVRNLLEKFPDRKYFHERDIQSEIQVLEENGMEYEEMV